MQVVFDLRSVGDGARFADPSTGGILYIPFWLEIDGEAYPSDEWEDYAVSNLLQWAEQLASGLPRAEMQFEFMDDAWVLRWEGSDDAEDGTLRMVHSGLEAVRFEAQGVHWSEFVDMIRDGISRMISGLSPYERAGQSEPAKMILALQAAVERI